jgi:hypothetical protein
VVVSASTSQGPGRSHHLSFRLYIYSTKKNVESSGSVQSAYNLYFSAYFFSRNSVFLSQKISQNSVSACFSAQPNGALS